MILLGEKESVEEKIEMAVKGATIYAQAVKNAPPVKRGRF